MTKYQLKQATKQVKNGLDSNKKKRKNTQGHQKRKAKVPKEVMEIEKHISKVEALAVWVKINGTSLSEELRHILLHPLGWLTDEHIDAGQFLIKELGTGVRGLRSITSVTHYDLVGPEIKKHPAGIIKCHNVGHHWVTSSLIVCGCKVILLFYSCCCSAGSCSH
eukprot:Seg3354.2 transcript_id=Seg3354.2/GoldUCD/mRNA.D3Y31 product="hypothetical protein" protein_id=Seg3354.2/GoldUCD/D3Y31